MKEIWYVIENDLIGGWSIGTADQPVSAYDLRPGSTGASVIADFVKLEDAEMVCLEHNASADGADTIYRVVRIPPSGENRSRWVRPYGPLARIYQHRGYANQFIDSHKSSTFIIERMTGRWEPE